MYEGLLLMFIGRMGEVDDLFYLFLLHEICSIAYSFSG